MLSRNASLYNFPAMSTNRKFLSLVILLSLAFGATVAQGARQIPGKEDKVGKLAQYYETLAARTLSRYYEETTFLVKAKVETEQAPDFDLSNDDALPATSETPPQLPVFLFRRFHAFPRGR